MRIFGRLAVALAFFATSALAQDGRLMRLSTGQDSRGWEAVGRLDIEGKGFCTASLIREDLVLTAAHCVYDRTGEPVAADRFTFNAGLREGRAEAYRNVRRVVVHPGYVYHSGDTATEVARDLALLQLELPIRTTRIRPYAVASDAMQNEEIGVVSYARGREEAPSLQDVCRVVGSQEDILIMSCEVNFGASGSPVFRIASDGAKIVSVVSAMSELKGNAVSLGTSLGRPLQELLAAFDGTTVDSARPRVITPGERNDTGAKFIRP